MRLTIGTVLVLAVLQMAAAVPQEPPSKTTIEGIVTRADTGQPIVGAQLTIRRVTTNATATVPPGPPPSPIAPVTTDTSGKFLFKDLNPGSYRLVATATGFMSLEYGDRRIVAGISSGTPFVLTGQSMKNVALQLKPTGTVIGRILDDTGQPAIGVPVQVLQYVYDGTGTKTPRQIVAGSTNDRGEYRIFGIAPGRYLIGMGHGPVRPQGGSGDNPSSRVSYAFNYYPGVNDVSLASVVEIQSGGETIANMTAFRQKLYTVRGRVVDAAGKVVSVAGLQPGQFPLNISMAYNFLNSSGSFGFDRPYDRETGKFELPNVPPGRYTLQAQLINTSPQTRGLVLSEAAMRDRQTTLPVAELPIVVENTDLEDIVLTFTAPVTVSGKLAIDGQSLSTVPEAARLQIRLGRLNHGLPTNIGLAPVSQPPDADGIFQIAGLRAGEYQVSVSGIPPNCYVKSLQFDGRDILGKTLEFSGARGSGFNVVLSSKPGQVSGMVTDTKTQRLEALIVLIPVGPTGTSEQDGSRNRATLYKITNSDPQGHFTFASVKPGNYKVFGWIGVEPYRYFDAEFMKKYETKGVAVTVGESAKVSANIQVITIAQD